VERAREKNKKKKSVCPLRGGVTGIQNEAVLPLVVGATSKTSAASLSPFSITLHDFYSRSILHKFVARGWSFGLSDGRFSLQPALILPSRPMCW
jgi:hypothetical protein